MEIKKRIIDWIDGYFHYIATMPTLILIGLIIGFPTFYLVYESLHVHNVLRQQFYFAGLENFVKMWQNADFRRYFLQTAIFTVGNVGVAFSVSLALAVALSKNIKFKPFFLAVILLPWTIPPVSSAILWGWVLNRMYGAANIILTYLGFRKYFFLGNPVSAMICLILVDAWVRIPLSVLVLYAGLQRVPLELEDAARVDGATMWQIFWKIKFHFIRPEVSMVLILLTMFAWREFSLPWTLTGGGPEDTTEIFGITIYRQANLYLRYGYAAAIGMFVLMLTVVLAYFLFKIRPKET